MRVREADTFNENSSTNQTNIAQDCERKSNNKTRFLSSEETWE